MNDIRDALAKNLKRLRASRGINQEQLAEAIGVSKETIAKTETKQNWLGADNLNRIIEYFRIQPAELFALDAPQNDLKSELEKELKAYIDFEIGRRMSTHD